MLNKQVLLILTIVSSISAAQASTAPTPEPTYGRCYEAFKERRTQLELQTLLVDPLAGIAGDGVGMVAGAELGSLGVAQQGITASGLIGTDLAGSLVGIGAGIFVAGSVGVVFETRSIILWAETAHTMKLIRESYANEGKALENLSARLNLTAAEIAEKITTWTDNGMLCDGSLKKHKPRNHRLKNLLPTPKELRAALIAG